MFRFDQSQSRDKGSMFQPSFVRRLGLAPCRYGFATPRYACLRPIRAFLYQDASPVLATASQRRPRHLHEAYKRMYTIEEEVHACARLMESLCIARVDQPIGTVLSIPISVCFYLTRIVRHRRFPHAVLDVPSMTFGIANAV